jgi:hypothetical protein
VRTFKSSIRVSLEEGRVSSLDPRSLSWRWGLRAIIEENDVVLWMRVVYHGRKRLKERREWRSEEELKEKGLVCFVLFLSLFLSILLVLLVVLACFEWERESVWNSEPKRSPNLNLSDVSRADFFVVLFSCFAYPTFYLTRLLPVPYYMYSLIYCSKKLEIKSLRKYR